jgi:CheY-like chemotaxis protein
MPPRERLVLLVEDNEDNQIIYRTVLEYSGFAVRTAAAGDEAIACARAEHPDLILMDISIPVVDGWEAIRTLKASAETSHIPIIALTAHALPEARARAFELGCTGYIAKPAEPAVVLSEVRRLLPAEPHPH